MRTLHVVQAGIQNGDKAWLAKAAIRHLKSRTTWIAPKSVQIGDDAVICAGLVEP